MLVIFIVLFFAILRSILSICGIVRAISFFKNGTGNNNIVRDNNNPRIIILICVLNEQKIVKNTLVHFNSMPYPNKELIFVTSAKEEVNNNKIISTKDFLERNLGSFDFKLLHYPYPEGTKADQLNFAIKNWQTIVPHVNEENTFFAFYDADSRPHKDTFNVFAKMSLENPRNNVFQQSSFFDFPIREKELLKMKSIKSIFLRGNAIRANRFVMGYEIPRIINKLKFCRKKNIVGFVKGLFIYAHCVGHGLFIRSSFAKKVYFPEGSVMEDMFYGFILNSINEPVIPLPVLNFSEVPNNFINLFFQMSRWFLGPSRFIEYFIYVRKHYRSNIKSFFLNCALIVSCAVISIAWLLTSPIFICSYLIISVSGFFLAYYISHYYSTLLIVLIIIFLLLYFISVVSILYYHNKLCSLAGVSYDENEIKFSQALKLIIFYPFILMFHSFPAYYAILDIIFHHGRNIKNKKTER